MGFQPSPHFHHDSIFSNFLLYKKKEREKRERGPTLFDPQSRINNKKKGQETNRLERDLGLKTL